MMTTKTRTAPKPIEIPESLKETYIGTKHIDQLEKLCDDYPEAVYDKIYDDFTETCNKMKLEQEDYRHCDTNCFVYAVMYKVNPRILDTYTKAQLLLQKPQFMNGSYSHPYQYARRKFIFENKLRTARFYRQLGEENISEGEYFFRFMLKVLQKERTMIAQTVVSHPTANPDIDFRQWMSDLYYPMNVAKEIIYEQNVYVELY